MHVLIIVSNSVAGFIESSPHRGRSQSKREFIYMLIILASHHILSFIGLLRFLFYCIDERFLFYCIDESNNPLKNDVIHSLSKRIFCSVWAMPSIPIRIDTSVPSSMNARPITPIISRGNKRQLAGAILDQVDHLLLGPRFLEEIKDGAGTSSSNIVLILGYSKEMCIGRQGEGCVESSAPIARETTNDNRLKSSKQGGGEFHDVVPTNTAIEQGLAKSI